VTRRRVEPLVSQKASERSLARLRTGWLDEADAGWYDTVTGVSSPTRR
jgi:hypothetical protein